MLRVRAPAALLVARSRAYDQLAAAVSTADSSGYGGEWVLDSPHPQRVLNQSSEHPEAARTDGNWREPNVQVNGHAGASPQVGPPG